MEQINITVELDNAVIQQKVQEYAMEGALKALKEYYTGYKSPYMEGITEALNAMKTPYALDLPDVLGLINQTLSAQITALAHESIAKTYLPLVNKMLAGEEAEVAFSKLLKEFIELNDLTDPDEVGIEMHLDEKYNWYNVKLWHSDDRHKKQTYDITLHEDYESRKETERRKKRYSLLSLPREGTQTFDFITDNGKVSLPFTPDILRDRFTSYCASLILSKSKIIIDTTDFNDDMFPNRCHCD